MTLKVPKLKRQTFETAIIERNQRREALWGTRVSPSTVSKLNKKIDAKIEAWWHKPIEGAQPRVLL